MRVSVLVVCACLMLGLAACSPRSGSEAESNGLYVVPDIAARRAQFQPHSLTANLEVLSPGDREALKHLVAAAREIDDIFKLQVWQGNPGLAPKVAALTGPNAQAAKDYYRIMYGPWDRLKDFEPFLGHTPHPPGAGFYPEDMTKQEFDGWVKEHPGDRDALTSLVTVVRRGDVGLVAVPYSEAYRPQLERAASELRAAAEATDNQSLKRFLELRADAFNSDDYYESDLAWMDLDSPLEVVIGPYETYEDGLFGYKASFEAFLCIVEPEDSKRLAVYKSELPLLERELPIPDEHKNLDRGTDSPIRVADEVFTAGDARAGVQTLAFNLPNDERVREAKGSKKVLLKNMMRAKYDAILEPVAARVLPQKEASEIDFDSYFHFILFHELAHGLGPGRITVDGRQTEVRLELKDLYSAFEEAKADVVGIYNLYELADRGVVPMKVVEHLPWTYVAGLFRAARFGTSEAHGLGVVMQTNYLLSKGAIEVTPDGRFQPHVDRFRDAIRDLAHDLLMIEALGSHEKAHDFVARYGAVPQAMQKALDRLSDIPVDVDPVYPLTGLQ
ncbi:MAG: peptidase [Acidobacteria bacterium]|nr:peptidase [Acidobacteriota bacterium]